MHRMSIERRGWLLALTSHGPPAEPPGLKDYGTRPGDPGGVFLLQVLRGDLEDPLISGGTSIFKIRSP